MGLLFSLYLASSLSQGSVNPVFCLVYPTDSTQKETLDQFQVLKTPAEVQRFAAKSGFACVEVQPGYFAVLPDHSKLERFLESRRALYKQCVFEAAGKTSSAISEMFRIGNLSQLCRQAVVPSLRDLGVIVDDSTAYHFEVDATLVLTSAGKSTSVPLNSRRKLSPEAERTGGLYHASYDPSRVSGMNDSLTLAVSKRPNVEISTGNLSIQTWGAPQTNSRVSQLSQLSFKRLVDEYTALEKSALKDEQELIAGLANQGSFWKNIGNAKGSRVSTLGSEITPDLSTVLYSNAVASGFTDQASVDRYLDGATVTSVRPSVTCFVWAKFPDGKVSRMGVGLF
jgi:hypothetical protein